MLSLVAVVACTALGQGSSRLAAWKFAVSGDSRNCGDVVMPEIAAGAQHDVAAFYWHLGDLRRITEVDEDIAHQPEHRAAPVSLNEYWKFAWDDFIENQTAPFGTMPFFLGIGNHETVSPKSKQEFLAHFSSWLDQPVLHVQRLRDNPQAVEPKTYFHWREGGIDFITLDNALNNQFDAEQIAWLEKILQDDGTQAAVRTIVVGMHEALPESIAKDHSMNASEAGTESGKRVYLDLLKMRDEQHKRVYVLASHSHYFMDGIFNTDYWRKNGGILPGWIIGTAGAQRYALPRDWKNARAAQTDVYGYLLATVKSDGEINFTFHRIQERDIPATVAQRYTKEFVHWCFAENSVAH